MKHKTIARSNNCGDPLLPGPSCRRHCTPSSHIVLASSHDGIYLTEEKVLV